MRPRPIPSGPVGLGLEKNGDLARSGAARKKRTVINLCADKILAFLVPPRGLYVAPPRRTKFTTERDSESETRLPAAAAIARVAGSANARGRRL